MIFSVKKKIRFLGILGPPYCGISATNRIGREMLCLPFAGFFLYIVAKKNTRIGGKNHVITYFFFKMGHSTIDCARWIRLNHIWTIVLFLV